MTAQPAIQFLASHYAQRSQRDEPAWLGKMRADAMALVVAQGLPTPRHENWKYTNLRSLHRKEFSAASSIPVNADSILPLSTHGFSFVNGQPHEHLPVDGLSARLLSDVLRDEPDFLSGELSALLNFERHPLAALNTAFFDDGIVIDIHEGQQFDQPLMLEFVSTPGPDPALLCPRVLIRMAADSRLQVIERHIGTSNAENFSSAVTEVSLGRGAQLEHYRLQEMSPGESAMHMMAVHQSRDSLLQTHTIDLGGKLIRNDLHTWLCGEGATARLSGLYMAVGSQHVDNHTRIDHNSPHTTSVEDYRGVLADKARAVFNGKVLVAQDAQKSNASQSNKNLILSGKAEIDTKPELEIYADDVRCSHGATIGQLDEEALFYLRARGIGEKTARALLTFAFADELLSAIAVDDLREYV
ncbi:MAG: Fe-S cluster assembly protein SufD, partial [Gammaproteobacteria bacterium]|nr:Fe-S cluster assembly protein SufD [Gammaproteobacteria bacterium]